MGLLNRRNALVGYVTWVIAKRVVLQKARQAVPAVDRKTRRPNKSAGALALIVAGTAVIVAFRSRRRSRDATDSAE